MSAVTKDLLRQVERVAIAPLRRIEAARPKGYVHTNYAAWKLRKREVETHAAKELAAIGATVIWSGNSASIALVGITARSGRGLLGALQNWRARAEQSPRKGEPPCSSLTSAR
ncbi:MAG: hypothetical protein CMN71_10660 [Sphingomonadaceae bacterium]|nr:hypothetical protein [Sphingomonadaceae bacterium]|tara:strand:+ start:468 stop:806 length:339 start_codon:yes stop_codon:yes gene_type:complete